MASAHEALVNHMLVALSSQPNIGCWPVRPGRYRHLYTNEVITIGPKGCGDVAGIIAPYGLAFFVECKIKYKRGRDTQRDTQENFELMVVKFGGIYVVAYSVEEAVEGIREGIERWKTQHTTGCG